MIVGIVGAELLVVAAAVVVVGPEVGTVVRAPVDTVVGEMVLLSVGGDAVVTGTVSVVVEAASEAGFQVSCNGFVYLNLHHTRHTYHPWVRVGAESPVVVRVETSVEQLPLHLEVFEMIDDRVGQDNSQGGVVAVAVADTHVGPEKGSAGVVVLLIAGREEAPVSSFAPRLGSTRPHLDQVVEKEPHESATAV